MERDERSQFRGYTDANDFLARGLMQGMRSVRREMRRVEDAHELNSTDDTASESLRREERGGRFVRSSHTKLAQEVGAVATEYGRHLDTPSEDLSN